MKNMTRTCIAAAISLAVWSNAFALGAAKPETRNRAEIPAEYRWDFSLIYPNWEAWEAGMKELDSKIDGIAKLEGTLKKALPQCSLFIKPAMRLESCWNAHTLIRVCNAMSIRAIRKSPASISASIPWWPNSALPLHGRHRNYSPYPRRR